MWNKLFRKTRHLLLWIPLFALVLLVSVWCTGALAYTFRWPGWLTWIAFLAALAAWGAAFRWKWLLALPGAGALIVIVCFAAVTPERMFSGVTWQKSWARNPVVEREDGGKVMIRNVRDFRYRSEKDFDSHYVDGEFDPAKVRTVDIALSHWDGMEAVAHTMLSFGFEDGRKLAVSMETRLPEGVEQGMLPGLFKQYGLLMILATEEDLFRLRSDFRKEDLYLYRTNATPEQARELFDYVVNRAESLDRHPEFYNSITSNCTTSLAPLLRVIDPSFEGDIRLLLNGFSDKLLFELGYLKHREGETFEELKKRRYVNNYAQQETPESYSGRIRTNL